MGEFRLRKKIKDAEEGNKSSELEVASLKQKLKDFRNQSQTDLLRGSRGSEVTLHSEANGQGEKLKRYLEEK
jgi:hypothetical protein